MVIKTYDAYTRLSTMEANRFTNFLFEHQEGKKATKKAIRKAIQYSTKDIPGLGGYVFSMEEKDEIPDAIDLLGFLDDAVVVRWVMDELLIIHPEYTEDNIEAAKAYLGEENVVELDLWLAGEDFAYYSQEIDACFYRLGTRNEEKGIVSGVHTPTFDIDESSLKIGMGLFAWLTIAELDK